MAAAFSIDKILDINNCCTIVIGIIRTTISAPDIIDQVNSNIRQRSEATAAMAVVAGLVIPLGIFMIILRLFKISVGALGRIIVIAVNLIPSRSSHATTVEIVLAHCHTKASKSAYTPQILFRDIHSCIA
ncbi:MAG: hypothetical protein MJE68_22700 [Proteobacteria bacterium]|nr:hypothetical protein [Pseudomonadota bacterium]